MAAFQKFAPREPPKTKEQLREMLRQAVQNTQPEKKPKARKSGLGRRGQASKGAGSILSVQETTEITAQDREALRRAVKSLERPGLAARLTSIVGKPVELIGYALPSFASKAVTSATSKGLEAALKVALRTLPPSPRTNSQLLHRTLATASGAAGGTFGLAALPVELPVSTVIMLRSIADIARSEGEDLSDPEAALSCVEVFALGGRAGSADASESGYFAVRSMLAKTVTEAARFVAERGVIKEGAPILLKFVTQIAACFGLVVTQKVAAQALPVVGALGGAAVNYAFMEHFQDVARGHFTVRRLERIYGKEKIRSEYNLISGEL
jgi:hypothetical protein